MVNQPHILLVGKEDYLPSLAELLMQDGAKTSLWHAADTQLPTGHLPDKQMESATPASSSLEKIDAVVFFDRIREQRSAFDSDAIIEQTLSTVTQLLTTVRNTVTKMLETKTPGQIIAVCDTSAIAGRRDQVASATVGGALIGMCKSLAKELGRYHISVNVICLGPLSEINDKLNLTPTETMMLKASGLGKPAELTHLAKNIQHLAQSEHWLNGQVLHINDGLVM